MYPSVASCVGAFTAVGTIPNVDGAVPATDTNSTVAGTAPSTLGIVPTDVYADGDKFGIIWPGPSGQMYPSVASCVGAFTAVGTIPNVDGAVPATDTNSTVAGTAPSTLGIVPTDVYADGDKFGIIWPGPSGQMYPSVASCVGAFTAVGTIPNVDGAVPATDTNSTVAGTAPSTLGIVPTDVYADGDKFGIIWPGPSGQMYPSVASCVGAFIVFDLPSLIHSTLGAGSPPNHKSYRIGRPFFNVMSCIPSPIKCGGTVFRRKKNYWKLLTQ
jgi:hypothetical protein